MSFFARGGPSREEMEQAEVTKRKITSTLKQAVQAIQRVYVETDEPVLCEDNVYTACSAVEAIFLHGLKSAVVPKSYWSAVSKVTHKDVVSQLNGLSQISTDVGRCRSWVRVALNDGVLISYLDALTADSKLLSRYYQRFAFLRDSEHMDIFKSIVQGLQNFTFDLPYNCSVLNLWTPTPLVLAGLARPHDHYPPPSQPTTDGDTAISASPTQTRLAASAISELPPVDPHYTPPPTSQLTARDIDEIRKLTLSSLTSDDNSSTANSQFSHPDFSESRIIQEALNDLEEIKFQAILADTTPIYNPSEQATTSDKTEAAKPEKLDEKQSMENKTLDEQKVEPESTEEESVYSSNSDQTRPKIANFFPDLETTQSQTTKDSTDATKHKTSEQQSEKPKQKSPSNLVFHPKKSPPLEPEPSKAVAASHIMDEVGSAGEIMSENVYPRVGNSVDHMQGWSSYVDGPVNHVEQKEPLLDAEEESYMAVVQESFDNLLHSYAPPSQQNMDVTSLSELIRDLTPPASYASPCPTAKSSPDDDGFDEYEILPDLVPGDKSYLSDPKYQPLLSIVAQLCSEHGLDRQNYQCRTCARPIGMFYGKARVCNFDGGYYCYECHENDVSHIPARIIHNVDFHKYEVARRNHHFLHLIDDEPLFNVEQLNPSLYDHVPELVKIRSLRQQLYCLKIYLFTCNQDIADELRRLVWPREYLLENIHNYSLNDLVRVPGGDLAASIQIIVQFASQHVLQCTLCSQKGFICEICKNPKVIFPFQLNITTRCKQCKSVYHSGCKTDITPCPKCARLTERRSHSENEVHSTYLYS